MIKVSIIFLFYYLGIYVCLLSAIDPDIVEEKRNKFAWMVVIINHSNRIATYGTIIHKQVVLTLAETSYERHPYFDFQVIADCYINETYSFDDNSKVPLSGLKNVSQYHIIENDLDAHKKSLALLILSEPFKLSQKINIINLNKENSEVDFDSCIILSLYSNYEIDGDTNSINLVTFVDSYAVRIDNNMHVNIITPPNDTLATIDEGGRIKSYTDEILSRGIKFPGSPLFCQLKNNEKWRQIGVVDLILKKRDKTSKELTCDGYIIRIDNDTIQGAFKEVIKESNIIDADFNDHIISY